MTLPNFTMQPVVKTQDEDNATLEKKNTSSRLRANRNCCLQYKLFFLFFNFLYCVFCASCRLQRPVQPQRGGSSARESVRIFRGLLQTEVPGAARQVWRPAEPQHVPRLWHSEGNEQHSEWASGWEGWGGGCGVFTFKSRPTRGRKLQIKRSLPPTVALKMSSLFAPKRFCSLFTHFLLLLQTARTDFDQY